MLRQFWRERPALEQIVAMTGQERGIHRIASGFVRLDDEMMPSAAARRARLPDERWTEYQRLFRMAGVPDGASFGAERVYFYAYASGLVGQGEEKGYVWSLEPLSPLARDLNDAVDQPRPPDLFRHIDGPWYLEYTADE